MSCPFFEADCDECPMNLDGECNQDPDLGGTGHGDMSFSDADPGL
jgi:hypothetical protein